MKKIISITGNKGEFKIKLAKDLAKNSAISFITPYTDCNVQAQFINDYHYVSKDNLDKLIERYTVLSKTIIDGNKFIFFEEQLESEYNILLLDDYAVADLRTKWDSLYTIKVYSETQKESSRVGVYLYDHEFDEVYDYESDDLYELEGRIEYHDWG